MATAAPNGAVASLYNGLNTERSRQSSDGTAQLYPLSNYTFGTKDPLYERDPSGTNMRTRASWRVLSFLLLSPRGRVR